MQNGNQRELFSRPTLGRPVHRPEAADLFGPEVVCLDADAIVRGFMAVLTPRGGNAAERDRAAVDAVRAWAMLDSFTRLHQNRPAVPDAKQRIMQRIREAAALQAFIDDGNDSVEARDVLDDRLRAARAELVAGFPGVEHHAFIVLLD
ncbi:MAG: hypothetical protein Q8Q80_00105 [Methyloversatilis sp.]|uniref:hypothetical protein n=1 Tax=Methyloversatilis sp. TaxID=2569862 RepID=UPI002734C979|nr:hypothetical protein [Methyloversatilis sp.]MDP3871041.1 hypothetical protein [Methyloversatilis sp.]